MVQNINNLDELLAEKARIKAQIQLVQGELNASMRRSREAFQQVLDEKLSLPSALAGMFQNGQQGAESTVVSALGRAVGMSSWWSGLLAALAPMLVSFVREQWQRRKTRQAEAKAAEPQTTAKAKPKRRNPFKRKKAAPEPGESSES